MDIRYRKNVADLSPADRKLFTDAMLELKKASDDEGYSGYNRYIRKHAEAISAKGSDDGYQNAAHYGPAFLPWHRELLRELEDDLRALDPLYKDLTIPYWDWMADPDGVKVFTDDLMGTSFEGSGTIQDGPFGALQGHWECVTWNARMGKFDKLGYLMREPYRTAPMPTMQAAIETMGNFVLYDKFPWNTHAIGGFRENMEERLHGQVHASIGGYMAIPEHAVNDPVFFLHHANVDRLWAKWQKANTSSHYMPREPQPDLAPGQSWGQELYGLRQMRPSDVWDTETQLYIGYSPAVGSMPVFMPWVQPEDSLQTYVSPDVFIEALGTAPPGAIQLAAMLRGFSFSYMDEDHHLDAIGASVRGLGVFANDLEYSVTFQDNDPSRGYQTSILSDALYLGQAGGRGESL